MAQLIYVTEDDDGIRETVKMALGSFSYAVETFVCAEDVLLACEERLPDLFVFDIMLPGMDGITAVENLRRRADTAVLPVLFLTAKDTEVDKVTGLDAGGDDYLVKPFGIMELAARVRALLRRTSRDNAAIKIANLVLNPAVREVRIGGEVIALTYKEYELLYQLMKNRDRVMSRDELLNTVWGYEFEGETRTLDTHIKSLRHKLGDSSKDPSYIITVRNVGYRFQGDQL